MKLLIKKPVRNYWHSVLSKAVLKMEQPRNLPIQCKERTFDHYNFSSNSQTKECWPDSTNVIFAIDLVQALLSVQRVPEMQELNCDQLLYPNRNIISVLGGRLYLQKIR